MPAPNERFTFGEIASLSWRNGGSNPAESDVRTRTEVTRRTFSVSRPCAKPPPRYLKDRGWTDQDCKLALAHIVCRTVYSASELKTVRYLQENSMYAQFCKRYEEGLSLIVKGIATKDGTQ